MSLEKEINDILDRIQEEKKQINFDSPNAREVIADIIARDLKKKSDRGQKYQSDAGSLIF